MLSCGLKLLFFQNKASLNYVVMADVVLTRIMEAKKKIEREVRTGVFPYVNIYFPILGYLESLKLQ